MYHFNALIIIFPFFYDSYTFGHSLCLFLYINNNRRVVKYGESHCGIAEWYKLIKWQKTLFFDTKSPKSKCILIEIFKPIKMCVHKCKNVKTKKMTTIAAKHYKKRIKRSQHTNAMSWCRSYLSIFYYFYRGRDVLILLLLFVSFIMNKLSDKRELYWAEYTPYSAHTNTQCVA